MTKALLPVLLIASMTRLYAQQPDGVFTQKVENFSPSKGVSTASIAGIPKDFNSLSELYPDKDKVISISIQFRDLTRIPDELSQFKNIEVIDLSHNKIQSVPSDFFKKFKHLKKVYLNNNAIPQAEIKRLTDMYPTIKFYYLPEHFH